MRVEGVSADKLEVDQRVLHGAKWDRRSQEKV